ncbi:cyclin-H-like [Hydractinia symbiolongicarpus]|uniref:cyclin-H-like n=1 Tax=Hydractinia symbiolongicarpus TaxID=13093 RepID=UPI00254EBEFD|nr:cyclin-H-like [Hydractinia symbiolongicarpus]
MFHQSTQKRFWLLQNCSNIADVQILANKAFTEKHKALCKQYSIPEPEEYMAYREEKLLLIYYSHIIHKICRKFKPPVPMSVVGMSIAYFKRFYLNSSVMEYHPKDVVYLCVYLACKVDEYNVSIDQFMGQVVSSPRPDLQMFIIDNELLLLQKLNFHLTVHSAYRPLEGFLIDLKTKDLPGIVNVEQYRQNAEKFLSNSLLSDVSLLYPPSQISLAALSFSMGNHFMVYLDKLTDGKDNKQLLEKIEIMKGMVVNFKFPTNDEISIIEQKLEMCRDREHDPTSEDYHGRERERKEAKELEKKKKYEELNDMQNAEDAVMLAQEMSD